MLSWCSLLNVSNDHSTFFGLFRPTLCPHFQLILTTHCYQLLILCIVQYLVVQCGCPLLHCLSLSGRDAELPLSFYLSPSLSLSLSVCVSTSACLYCLASLCLPLLVLRSLLCVPPPFFYSSWVAQACEWPMTSVSRCVSPLIRSQASSDRCSIAYNFATLLVLPHIRVGARGDTNSSQGPIDRPLSDAYTRSKNSPICCTSASRHRNCNQVKFVSEVSG